MPAAGYRPRLRWHMRHSSMSHYPQRRSGTARRALALLLLLIGVFLPTISCDRGAKTNAEQRAKAAESRLAQMNSIGAENDTLLSELMATTTFISQVGAELSKTKPMKRGTMVAYDGKVVPMAEYRSAMLTRIRELGERLDQSEMRLQASQDRLRTLAANDRQMTAHIEEFGRTVAQYKAMVEEQRAQILRLNDQVETLLR
jgi:septal ring factor EnvC (AmiA/AmiB activator)